MKKEKGFTLVELLAVIVIIAVVGLIATASVLTLKEKMNIKMFNELLKEIITSAETYGSDNKEAFEIVTADNYDYDLNKIVVRRTVKELQDMGYEKTSETIYDPNTGNDISNLIITIFEANESGRIKACIKNISESGETSDEENQYLLLSDLEKTKYNDVYCIDNNNLNDLLKDKPIIEVLNTKDELEKTWKQSKTVNYRITDGGNNLGSYAVVDNPSKNECKSVCNDSDEWQNASNKTMVEGTYTIAPENAYIKEANICICAKETLDSSKKYETALSVTIKRIDSEKPIIDEENSLIVIKNNKVDSSTKVIPDLSETDNKERYMGYIYDIYNSEDDTLIYSTDERYNGSLSDMPAINNICDNKPTIKATLVSKSNMSSDPTPINIDLKGCVLLKFITSEGSFENGSKEKLVGVQAGTTYVFGNLGVSNSNRIFNGWKLNNKVYSSGDSYEVGNAGAGKENIPIATFTADWGGSSAYSIRYVWNLPVVLAIGFKDYESHGTNVANPQVFTLQNVFSLAEILASFEGWSFDQNEYYTGGTKNFFKPNEKINIDEICKNNPKCTDKRNITLYGVWKTFEWTATEYDAYLEPSGNIKTKTYDNNVMVSKTANVSFSNKDHSGLVTLNFDKNIYASKSNCLKRNILGMCTEKEFTNNSNEAIGTWIGDKFGINLFTEVYTSSHPIYKIKDAQVNNKTITFETEEYYIKTKVVGTKKLTSQFSDTYINETWALDGKTYYVCSNCPKLNLFN